MSLDPCLFFLASCPEFRSFVLSLFLSSLLWLSFLFLPSFSLMLLFSLFVCLPISAIFSFFLFCHFHSLLCFFCFSLAVLRVSLFFSPSCLRLCFSCLSFQHYFIFFTLIYLLRLIHFPLSPHPLHLPSVCAPRHTHFRIAFHLRGE